MYNYITHKEKPKQRYHRFHTITIHTMETNIDKANHNNEFFFNEEGKVRMGNLHQYEEFWVDYDDIWLKIKAGFDGNYDYISKLMQSMVVEAYKIRPFPTLAIRHGRIEGW